MNKSETLLDIWWWCKRTFRGWTDLRQFFFRIGRTASMVRIYWWGQDVSADNEVYELMRHQIRRTRKHIEICQMHANWESEVKNMIIVENLITRLLDEDYPPEQYVQLWKQDNEMLFDMLKKYMSHWWC